jgi:hypothetical protein
VCGWISIHNERHTWDPRTCRCRKCNSLPNIEVEPGALTGIGSLDEYVNRMRDRLALAWPGHVPREVGDFVHDVSTGAKYGAIGEADRGESSFKISLLHRDVTELERRLSAAGQLEGALAFLRAVAWYWHTEQGGRTTGGWASAECVIPAAAYTMGDSEDDVALLLKTLALNVTQSGQRYFLKQWFALPCLSRQAQPLEPHFDRACRDAMVAVARSASSHGAPDSAALPWAAGAQNLFDAMVHSPIPEDTKLRLLRAWLECCYSHHLHGHKDLWTKATELMDELEGKPKGSTQRAYDQRHQQKSR